MEQQDAVDVGEGSKARSGLVKHPGQHQWRRTKKFTLSFYNMVVRSRMEQHNVVVGEGSETLSRRLRASSAQHHTPGQFGGITPRNAGASASTSTHCHSTRIQDMIQNRSNFTSEVEFDIAYSKDHHWSKLVDSDLNTKSTRVANAKHFRELKNHPEWGAFFMSVKVVVGKKINEGAQAEIYDAKVEFEDGHNSLVYGYHVVKVMKGNNPLQDFQRQWPVGMLCNASKARRKGPLMWILGGTMIRDRFAFIMPKQWGDLRKLIDEKMQLDGNQGPPKFEEAFLLKVLLCIAKDMDALHTEHDIIHRDLKASNILLWSLGEGLSCNNLQVKATVVDYECSMEVVGTRFWRAPEILQQLRDGVQSSELVFTKAADIYSYGMVCYELLSGRIPYEEYPPGGIDVVLNGGRPLGLPLGDFLKCNLHEAQEYFQAQRSKQETQEYYEGTQDPIPNLNSVPSVKFGLFSVMQLCWNHEPSERPTFSEIVELLGSKSLETARVQRMRFGDSREPPGNKYHVVKVMKRDNPPQSDIQPQLPIGMLLNASKDRAEGPLMWGLDRSFISNGVEFMMPKQWGDLRKLIDVKMQLDDNRGPPEFEEAFLLKVLLCIARDMDKLHTKHDIIHRDLKASNILLWSLGEGLPYNNPGVAAHVVDYECSMGVVVSGFWRAPEIFQQLKDGVRSSELVFTKAADVYSYGMVCYELLSGRIPYEEYPPGGINVVLNGGRPLGLPPWDFLMCNQHKAQEYFQTQRSKPERQEYYEGTEDPVPSLDFVPSVKSGLLSVMQLCWNHEPSERPTFSEIVELLGSKSLETARVQRMRFGDGREPPGYKYHVVKVMKRDNPPQSDIQPQLPIGMLLNASKDGVEGPLMWGPDRSFISNGVEFMTPKQWGDLRKLINVKMQLDGNGGPPKFEEAFLLKVLLCIARDMDALHTKYGIICRDLDPTNILVWSLGEALACNNPHVRANVFGYEHSLGVEDLVFGRAPEIFQQLNGGVRSSELVFTKAVDVYNYGEVCYELLTGYNPGVLSKGLDGMHHGVRPLWIWDIAMCLEQNARNYFKKLFFEQQDWKAYYKVTKDSLPSFCFSSNATTALFSVMLLCLNHKPSNRPTFSEIIELLESWKV